MNKIFKVVWSKTKECYVVVSEVAKNNGGKKKVLASVLAGLAMVGATAQMGTPVQAGSNTNGNNINVWSNQRVDTPTPGGPAVTNTNTQNTAGDNSVTIGQQLTTGTGAVAVGRLSTAAGDRAVAIGENVNAKKEDTISVGSSNNSNTGGGITIGKGNTADSTANGGRAAGNSQIAIGRDNKASQEDTLALGRANTASGSVSVAIGSRSEATNSGSIAIAGNGDGYKTTSTGQGSIAIGMQSNSTGKASTAVGGVSQATATGAAALGYSANATAESATALGQESVASVKDGVALGSHSKATTAAGVDGYNPADSRTNTYAGLSGNAKTSTLAAVSVGDGSNATRQITGLAAGKEDTDAVNVAQLKNVNLKYAGNSGSGDVLLNNGTLNLKGEGLISTKADGNGVTVKIATGNDITNNNGKAVAPSPNGVATTDNVVQAINKAGWNANASANGGALTGSATATKVVPGDTVTFSAGKNLTVAQTLGTNAQQYTYSLNKDVDLTSGGSLTVGGTTVTNGGVTITAPTGGTTTNVTLTNAGLNNGGNKITNVAEGKADNDAVNVKQLKDAKTILKDGKNTTVVGTGTAADPYKVNVEGALTGITSISNATTGPKMTFGGSSINITGGNLSLGDGTTNNKIVNVAPGTDDNDAVNVKQLKDTELHITPGTYTPDANKKVKLTYTDGNSTVVAGKEAVIDLSSLATGGTTSTEKVQKAADATGDKNIAEVGPKSGDTFGAANATYEVSVSRNAVKDAAREAVTVNNGGNTDNPISVTPTPDNSNHNTTYAVTFDGNKAAKQIPLTYKANGTGDKTVKLDKGLDFTNGTNTTSEIGNDGVVKFNLNKDVDLSNTGSLTVGGTKVNNGGVTITAPAGGTTTDVKLTNTGLDNGGNKIINVKDGDVNATSKDAVNGSQLHAVAAKERHIAPTTASHAAYTVDNNGDVTLDYVDGDGNATTEKAVIKGIANRDLSNISNAGETKIKNLAKSAIDMEDGKNTKTSNREVNGVKTFKVDVEGALTDITSITNGGTNNGKISFGPNKTVTVDGDHSITLNASTGNIGGLQNKTFDPTNFTSGQAATEDQLKSVHDTLKASELHIAPTAGATNNVAEYTVDANNKVTLTYQDGNGTAVAAPKAVIDLSALANKITSGYTFNTNAIGKGGTVDGAASVKAVDNGGTINYAAGKNLTVKQEIDTTNKTQTYTYSLDKDINVETVTVTGQNGKDGKIGINGKDGVTRTISVEVPGQPGQPGTPGVDGTTTTRIVFDDKAQANLDDGLKFTGNNESTENKHKLNTLVKVQGEGTKESTAVDPATGKKYVVLSDGTTKFESAKDNIAVEANGTDTLTVKLNKNLKGLDSVQTKTVELGDHTTPGGTTNITYNTGDNRIEYTTPGATPGTTDTKKVATTDDIWTIQGNGIDVPAKAGKVNLVAGDHITITPDAANGKMTISATGLGTMNSFDVTANNGATSKTITDGKKVDFNAGSNLTVKQTSDANGTHIEYALNKDVDLGTNGSLKIGDTTINNGGLTIANGPSITNTGVDAGDKKITNVADGAVNATSKDAVNGSQLKKYTDAAKTTVEAGDTNVTVDTDNSAADGHTNYKVSLKPVVEIGDTHKVKIDGHTGDITGLTNVTLNDPTFATKGRAATEEQLKQVLTEAKNKAIEKVQAGTAAAGDTNIATVAPKAGDTFGAAGATYEVSVSKNAVKDAAKEAVKVTSVSPAITVTPDTSVAHETTYKVGFDGNQAATQIPLTYKQNGGSARTVKLSDGLNFIDGTNTKARTAADGKVTFDVMGDLTGITSISNTSGGPKMTFGGSSINVTGGDLNMGGNNKIVNLAPGKNATDAATVGQLTKINSTSTVIAKNVGTAAAPVYELTALAGGTVDNTEVNMRIDQLGEEVGRVGAQGAALSALKPIQYDPLEPTQIMAGYGNYRGTSAIAMGVAHYKNESTLIHGGISWAGGSSHMMANAGVTWKVGNRDSEAAVADRYRKGPISSAYAMQQEMAAMKAQNAGLKGEVSDLKAENEQMKAQIAAMMAKLGL